MNVRLSLDVWLDGYPEPVGNLDALDSGSASFRYRSDYLAEGKPISLSLPLTDNPVGDATTRAFFDNLLPENDQMQRVIDREGLDRGDIVGILAHVGGDCAGALSCLPLGSPPIKVPGALESDYRPLEEEELGEIVTRLAERRRLPEGLDDPSPVAGVQGKLALTVLTDGRLGLPSADRKVPTTHILKVPRRAEAGDAVLEEAASSLAAACGFAVSNSRHVEIHGIDALLIERFDRIITDGVVYRLHQEDFAQALGLPASLKYERRGREGRRFDASAIHSVLMQLDRPAPAVETFLLATIFNLAIGNNDNHAKNHGIMHRPASGPVLAPLYDLLPIRLHSDCTDELAFNIGSATHFDKMEAADVSALLAYFGFEGRRAERFIHGPVRAMLEKLEEAAHALRPAGLRHFYDLIGREIERLASLLGLEIEIAERDHIATGGGGWAIGS